MFDMKPLSSSCPARNDTYYLGRDDDQPGRSNGGSESNRDCESCCSFFVRYPVLTSLVEQDPGVKGLLLTYARPYTTRAVTVLVGSRLTEYTVLEAIIDKHQGLKEKLAYQAGGPCAVINLQKVDDEIGHTLIHYLYTGEYQVLGLESIPLEARTPEEFKTSILAYCAARHCGIDSLEDLTKTKIEQLGNDLSIFDLHRVAEQVSAKLPGDADWFSAQLNRWIKSALQADDHLLSDENLFNLVRGTFDKAILKAVAEMYTKLKPADGDAQPDQAMSNSTEPLRNGNASVGAEKSNGYEGHGHEPAEVEKGPSKGKHRTDLRAVNTNLNGANNPKPAPEEISPMPSEEPSDSLFEQPQAAVESHDGGQLQGATVALSPESKLSKKSKKKKKRADSVVVQPFHNVDAD